MEVWKRQNPVEWDAPTKEAGGAEYKVWEAMLELQPLLAEAGPKNPEAVTLLSVLQQAFEKRTADGSVQLVNFQVPSVIARFVLRFSGIGEGLSTRAVRQEEREAGWHESGV